MVTTIAAALFAIAGGWTLLHRKGVDDVVLSVGLFLVAGACLSRIDALEHGAQNLLPGGTGELVKHLLIATGCICIASYGSAVVLNRPVKAKVVAGAGIGASATMCVAFFTNGPWTNADLSEQLTDRPWMIAYWIAYYGAFCWSVIALGLAALRGNSQAPRRHAAWLILLALASLVAVVWALLSIAKNLFLLTGADPAILDAIRSPAAATFSVCLMVGFLGYTIHRTIDRSREVRCLEALHHRLTVLVPEVQLVTLSPEIADYHRDIEIADALSMLAPFNNVSDAALIEAVLGHTKTNVARAYCIEIAAERRKQGGTPNSPITFDWTADGGALVEVGRAMSERNFSDGRRKVTSVGLG